MNPSCRIPKSLGERRPWDGQRSKLYCRTHRRCGPAPSECCPPPGARRLAPSSVVASPLPALDRSGERWPRAPARRCAPEQGVILLPRLSGGSASSCTSSPTSQRRRASPAWARVRRGLSRAGRALHGAAVARAGGSLRTLGCGPERRRLRAKQRPVPLYGHRLGEDSATGSPRRPTSDFSKYLRSLPRWEPWWSHPASNPSGRLRRCGSPPTGRSAPRAASLRSSGRPTGC